MGSGSLVGWIERSEPSGGLRRGERRPDYCPDWRFARLWPLAFFPFCGAWAGPRLSFVNFNQNNWNSWWEVLLLKPAFLIIMVKKRQGVIFAVLDYGHERQLMFHFLKTCLHWQGEQMTKKDERLKLINEVLKGMKVRLLTYFCFWLLVSLPFAYVLTTLSFPSWQKNQRCRSDFLYKLFLFES